MATESKEDKERASQPEVQPNAVTVAVLRANGLPAEKNYFVRVNVGAMLIQTQANNEDSQNPVFNAQYTVPQSNERVNVWFEVFEKGWLQNVRSRTLHNRTAISFASLTTIFPNSQPQRSQWARTLSTRSSRLTSRTAR